MKAPVSHLKDPDLQKAPQALLRASEKARQLAANRYTVCRTQTRYACCYG